MQLEGLLGNRLDFGLDGDRLRDHRFISAVRDGDDRHGQRGDRRYSDHPERYSMRGSHVPLLLSLGDASGTTGMHAASLTNEKSDVKLLFYRKKS